MSLSTTAAPVKELPPRQAAELLVWIDGKLVPKNEAKVSVFDHGLLYGDGVFEGIRVYHGRIFERDAHVDRLFLSAKAIRLTIPMTREQIAAAMEETVRVNGFSDCYIRLIVTRGVGYLGLSPSKCETPTVIVISDLISLYPQEMYESGMSIITASMIRNHANALPPRVKSLNYLNNILAKIEANDAGVPEALMLNGEGNVAECTGDNVFIVRGSQVQTPSTSDGILEGITRKVVMDLCAKLKIDCREKTLQRHDLIAADECFLTGSAAEVIPVTCIDGRTIGTGKPGPVTRRLIEAFRAHVKDIASA